MFVPTTSSGPPGVWEVSLQMPLLLDSSEVAWPAEGTMAPTTAANAAVMTAACITSAITVIATRDTTAMRNALVWARLVAADPASPATGVPTPVLPTARAVAADTGGGDILGTTGDVSLAGLLGATQRADGDIGAGGFLDAELGALLGEGLAGAGARGSGGLNSVRAQVP